MKSSIQQFPGTLWWIVRSLLTDLPARLFGEALLRLTSLLASLLSFLLVVIADQRPAPGSDKFQISFLDQDTAVQTGGERMAASSQAAFVYVESQKMSRFSYEFTFRLMEHPDRSTPLSITKSYYNFLENSISRAPSYWLWSHNRWKIPSLGAIHSS